MSSIITTYSSSLSLALLLLLALLVPSSSSYYRYETEESGSSVPAMFAFGDSIVDNGNNQYISDVDDPATYLPYGLDFDVGPSGRFTNNGTVFDELGIHLGLPFLPAFLSPNTSGKFILKGVNYASAGSGILDYTPMTGTGGHITLSQQVTYFLNTTLPELKSLLDGTTTSTSLESYISKSIFAFYAGGVDYYSCFYEEDINCTTTKYANFLVEALQTQVKRVYGVGARKFALFSSQVLGCTPAYRMKETTGECVESYNVAATNFNNKLRSSVDAFAEEMPGSNVVVVNVYGVMAAMINNPSAFGFKVVNDSCCEMSGTTGICAELGTACSNRSEYVFFDGAHTTDAANTVFAYKAYHSEDETEVYPFNVKTLVNTTTDHKETLRLVKRAAASNSMVTRTVIIDDI